MAQAQLLLSRSYIQLKAEPGRTIVDAMSLHNTSDRGVKIKVYWQDFNYIEPFDGTKEFYPAGTSAYTMGSWISFSPKEFTLAPHTKQEVNYSIKVPADVEGGHYGVLFFEQEALPSKADSPALSIVTRLGSLFFVDSTKQRKTAIINDITVAANAFSGKLKNDGDVILLPQGIFYVLNKEGLAEDRGEIKKLYLPPGKEADFEFATGNSLKGGFYTAVLTFDLGDGDSIVKEIDFNKDPSGQLTINAVRD